MNCLLFDDKNGWKQLNEKTSETKIKNARVCSKHFISGKPSELAEKLNPDWVPSVDMGYSISGSTAASKSERYERSIKRKKVSKTEEKEEVPPAPESEDYTEDVLCSSNNRCIQTKITMEKLTDMFLKMTLFDDMQKKFNRLVLTYDSLRNDDEKTRYFTGLDRFKVFEILASYITPFIKIHPNTVLPANEQFLLTLVKLRLNSDYKNLAYRFGVCPTTVSTYFKNVLHIMCLRLKKYIFWPDRSILKKQSLHVSKNRFMIIPQ
ncbi:unnamed protein product [Callosobruchus maculatus]|uniref:Transposase Helix-turn-helix domain-containing protein n=1 Tax=Callosobruchus maculatus TaxID=64391 RepID=A0A653CZ68_CALMS|nr:unnamed protein product [Callosobruchus maculatus]